MIYLSFEGVTLEEKNARVGAKREEPTVILISGKKSREKCMAIEKSLVPPGFEEYTAVTIDKDSKVTRYTRYRPIKAITPRPKRTRMKRQRLVSEAN